MAERGSNLSGSGLPAANLSATAPESADRPEATALQLPWLFVVFECDRPLAGGWGCSLGDVDTVAIGRGNERAATTRGRVLDLRLPSHHLSASHASLRRDRNGWTIHDTTSRNGTYVQGRRITQHALQDGDLIELGRVVLRYRRLPSMHAKRVADVPAGFRTLLPDLALGFDELARIAQSPLPILLLGETGTGKELVARGVHQLSRRSGPLVPVNCGALSASLLDSQLFGHVRGAFTGALSDAPGFVRAADGGTLFLDEIGDLPLPAQAALLRVLQEREVVPVGGTRAIQVDLRIIAATHHRLDLLAARGDFRQDLFARLSGHTQYLTPLRERREDIGGIVAELLRRMPDGGVGLRFAADAGRELVAADWPLNIRQLEQGLARATTLAEDGVVQLRHLITRPPSAQAAASAPAPAAAKAASRCDEMRALLVQHHGNISDVARTMGCSRMHVHRLMQRYDLDAASFRPERH